MIDEDITNGSILPLLINETDDEIAEVIICDDLSGGAEFRHDMPNRLTLRRILANGTEYRGQYNLESLRERTFKELADEWHNDTDFLSSPTKRKNHRAYRKILSMGMPAVPYILRDLRDHGGDWYEALMDITGVSLITPHIQGKVQPMKEAWFEWGRGQGYDLW